MKRVVIFLILLNSLVFSANSSISEKEKKARLEKQIQIEMEKEKKYSKEQVFYNEENYDFKGAEVDPAIVDSIQNIEVQDDFDMDSVYD